MKGVIHTARSDGSIQKYQTRPILFNVAEMRMKLSLRPADVLLAEIDEIGSRNKKVYIKGEKRVYTLMNISFFELQAYAIDTIMVNKRTLISIEAVHDCTYDIITLKDLFTGWDSKQVTLSRKFHDAFYARMGLKK
jgi:hypothetical protein